MERIIQKNFLKCSFIVAFVMIFPKGQCEIQNEACSTIPKLGQCPNLLVYTQVAEKCLSHSDCPGNLLCCESIFDEKKCSSPRDSKIGECPSTIREIHNGKKCFLDSDCKGRKKCCPKTPCDYYCQDIISEKDNSYIKLEHYFFKKGKLIESKDRKKRLSIPCENKIPKYGKCPIVLRKKEDTNCISNDNCPGNLLCCRDYFTRQRMCSDPYRQRAGFCPPPDKLLNPSPWNCYIDENCSGTKLCCQKTPCSYVCSDRLTSPPPSTTSTIASTTTAYTASTSYVPGTMNMTFTTRSYIPPT